MKFNLYPAEFSSPEQEFPPTLGSRVAADGKPASADEVRKALLLADIELLRAGLHGMLVDASGTAHIDEALKNLQGWEASPEQSTSNESAFEGVLEHQATTRRR